MPPKHTVTQQLRGSAEEEEGIARSCLGVQYDPTLCVAVQVVRPELQITKVGPTSALACEELTYAYRVTNTGSGVARDVRVEDALAEGIVTAQGQQRVVSQVVGDIPAGQTKEFTARVRATGPGRFGSRAIARSAAGVEAQTREVITELREPVLAVAVEGPEAEYVGRPVNYRVTVRNTGDAPPSGRWCA